MTAVEPQMTVDPSQGSVPPEYRKSQGVTSMEVESEVDLGGLAGLVNHELLEIIRATPFREWANQQKLRAGDIALLNNSVLFRDSGSGTLKNSQYTGVRVGDSGKIILPPLIVTTRARVNVDFKRIPSGSINDFDIKALGQSIDLELQRMGMILTALVSRIGDDEPVSVSFKDGSAIQSLCYEPDLPHVAEVHEEILKIGRLDDIDIVWQATRRKLREAGESAESVSEQFEDAFHRLQEEAGRPVTVGDVTEGAPSILGEITASLGRGLAAYDDALAAYLDSPDTTEPYHELLRIAYNFADGAASLLTLAVGTSDLKPLVSWLTLSSQFSLATTFRALPFSIVGKAKPSLRQYQSIIAQTRNRAFHDVFAFGRPFRIKLTGDAFAEPELRLFREYGQRTKPALEYADRELVELLSGFTRVAERAVPVVFWEKNLDVMRAIVQLATKTRDALVAISEAQPHR